MSSDLNQLWIDSMQDAMQTILDFVEGRMASEDFKQQVYNNSQIETLLSDESLTWHSTYIKTNPYYFIIERDFDDPGDLLSIQGALQLFLDKKQIAYSASAQYSDEFDILIDAQPRWLAVDAKYVKDHIFPDAGERTRKDLKKWLAEQFALRFRYNQKPPSWIQSPAWPIGDAGPLYFLGQLKLKDCELFHDEAAAYVFVDTTTGETKTIIQVF